MDRAVDPEAVDYDAMSRRLFRVVAIGSHSKRAAGYPDHVRVGRLDMRGARSGRCNVTYAHAACIPAGSRLKRRAQS